MTYVLLNVMYLHLDSTCTLRPYPIQIICTEPLITGFLLHVRWLQKLRIFYAKKTHILYVNQAFSIKKFSSDVLILHGGITSNLIVCLCLLLVAQVYDAHGIALCALLWLHCMFTQC